MSNEDSFESNINKFGEVCTDEAKNGLAGDNKLTEPEENEQAMEENIENVPEYQSVAPEWSPIANESFCEGEAEKIREKWMSKNEKLYKERQMAKIINAAVNLEHTMFSISTQEGFKIFELHPVTYKCYENSIPDTGPVRIARQFARTNIVVYVSAKNGKYPQNVTWVFDAEGNKNRLEITTPGACGPVTNVHVCENRLVIFTAPRVFVYQFPKNPKQIRTEETRINPFGLSAMSYDPTTAACYLAYPGYKTGTVQILNLNTLTERESKAPVVIEAHLTDITQIALNCQGTLVATGSTKGTVIRVFDARTKGMLYELRRGTVQAHLSCISFSPCSSYLAVASDKGTLHVFGIRDSENQKKKNVLDLNRGSSSLMKFNLERDVLALGFTKQTTRSLQSLVAICSDGTYWQYHFSKDNGAMSYHQKADKFENLIEMVKDTEFWREPI